MAARTLIHNLREVVLSLTDGFYASARQVGITVEWPVEAQTVQNQTASANTVNTEEQLLGLASLIGKYDDDPTWEEFPQFLAEYRRQIDKMNRD